MKTTSIEKVLKKTEDELFSTDDYAEIPPQDIIAYNELRSCADLFRMHQNGLLDTQPSFQREFVWKGPEQTRFVDSLLKQLPIPSMCFATDMKQQRWIVIDGLQRMSTIIRFLKGSDWKLSKLDDIDKRLSGASAAAIKTSESKLNEIYTRIENLTVPITVLRCDFTKKQHMEYLFTIFHRLNSGGAKLTNQEIRNGIYGGSFNELLRKLDKGSRWRRINKIRPTGYYRYRYQEVILRFFTFFDKQEEYGGHLAKFLNDYMHDNRSPSELFLKEKEELFNETVECVSSKVFGGKSPPEKVPITILEAVLVGVGKNLGRLSACSERQVREQYLLLLSRHEFSEEARKEGLSKKEKVQSRLDTAINVFNEI